MRDQYFPQNTLIPSTATCVLHPTLVVAPGLMEGPAWGTLLVGELAAEPGKVS